MNTGSAYPTMGSIAATPVVATPFSAATPAPDNDYYSAPGFDWLTSCRKGYMVDDQYFGCHSAWILGS